MLGLLFAKSEGMIDVVANVRPIFGKPVGKAGDIDVRHFKVEGF